MITRTIDVWEIVWTLAALPGLVVWFRNLREAAQDFRAVREISPRNGRYLWARFSALLTRAFVGLEVLFVVLGVVNMVRVPPADPHPEIHIITVGGLVLASVVITLIGYRWSQVNAEIVQAARDKHLSLDRELPP